MVLLITGLLGCFLLPAAMSQTGSGYYPQSQQSGGFYPSPMSAPYPAASPAAPSAATPNSGAEAQAAVAPTGPGVGPSAGGVGFGGLPFFPPTGGAFLGIAPYCTKIAIAITRLHSLIEPIKALIIGAFVFFAIKNYALPYLIYYARAVEEEDVERSLGKDGPLDPVTLNILKAISKGVCLDRLACQAGKKAQEYELTKEVVRAIDSSEPERLVSIFRAAAAGEGPSCESFRCDRKLVKKRKNKYLTS